LQKEGAKFDYEVIEPGAKFNLNIEVTLDGNDDDFKKRMLATIIKYLEGGQISIGAKTNSGFGRIKLTDYQIYTFNFTKKEDVLRWLKQDFSAQSEFNADPFELKSQNLHDQCRLRH
jgi:CRISPR/Cas system CSM-associated protein Csm3 (group 7 of RAMP superfamily)